MIEWQVILNRTGARIFKTTKSKDSLRLVKEFKNPLGQERKRAMQTDRPGVQKFRVRGASALHAMVPKSDPHEEAAVQFVRKLATWLMKESSKNNFERLAIFADPHLRGILKPKLEDCKAEIVWHSKNLSKLSNHAINQRVHEYKRT